MHNRPLMTGCILYLALLAVLFLLSGSFVIQVILCAGLILLFVLAACIKRQKCRPWSAYLPSRAFSIGAAVCVVLALTGVRSVYGNMRALQTDIPVTAEVTGVVERIYWANDSSASFLIDLDTVNGKRVHGKIGVDCTGNSYYAKEGSVICCQVIFGDEDRNTEYAENRAYAFPDGIYAYTTAASPITVLGERVSFRTLCDSISEWCRYQLYRFLPEDAAELCISILLGDKSVLSPQIKRDFRRVGISHVLAVSGLHLSILCSGLLGLLQSVRLVPKRRYAVVLLFIILYMGITGFSPSVMRAGMMWILSCIAQMWHARTDALTSLFFSAACICAVAPHAVFDVGLMLSVCATFGLIVLMRPLSVWLNGFGVLKTPLGRVLRSVIELTATTTAAAVFTMPIILAVFKEISLIAPLSNLLLHIPVAVLLYLTPILLLLSLIPSVPPIGLLRGFLAGVLSGDAALIEDVTAWLSRLPHVLIGVRYVFAAVILLSFFALFGVLYVRCRNILLVYPVYAAFLITLLLSLQIHAYMTREDVTLTYSVLRKNDVVTIVHDGRGMLIDASDGSYTVAKHGWEQLSEQNMTELDVLVLTHYHTRHISALSKLVQNTVIRTVVLPYPLTEEETHLSAVLSDIAEHGGCRTRICRRGEEDMLFGDVRLSLFPAEYLQRSTQPLMGYRISCGEDTVLYLGGAAFEAADGTPFSEQRQSALKETDFLLLGVHGPLYKQDIACSVPAALRAVITANAEIGALLTHDIRAAAKTVMNASEHAYVRIVLRGAEP